MWLKLTDAFDESPRIMHTARTDAEVDRIVGIVVRLMLYCSRQRTDGFVPALVVRQRLRSARLRRAFTCPDDGSAPLLHPRGTDCPCMRGMTWPATAGDYYVHGYLDNNPLAAEYDIAAQQRAELRDPELRLAVTRRDRERCRYCGAATRAHDRRSRTGRVLDHVDPGQAAGAANLVVACRECNSRKGRRTLAAAGLTLLPVPGDQLGAGVVVQDADLLPTPVALLEDADLLPTYDQTCDDDPDPTNREDTDVPGRDGTGRVHAPRPRTAGWAGPNGERHQTGPAPPRNSSTHPNPYLRVAITGPDPDDHAGLPDDDDLYGDDLPP